MLAVPVFLLVREGTGITSALAVLDDESRFTTTRNAADAFLEASTILQESCAEHEGDLGCEAVLQAAAYTQVLSFQITGCTQPDVYDARQALLRYLSEVDRLEDTDTAGPDPPSLPEC